MVPTYIVHTLILLSAGVGGREFLRTWRSSMNDVITLSRFLFVDEGVESGAGSGWGLLLVEATEFVFDLCDY